MTNNGNKDLTILKSSLIPMVGVFAPMLPADGTKVAAGKSLTVNIDCIPAMIGMATGKVELDTDDPAVPGGTPFIVALSVNGVIGNVTVAPSMLDFSSTPIYVGQTSAPQMVHITNVGKVTIDNLTLMPSGPDAGDFNIVTGFKSKLMPNDVTDIGIVFAPHVAKTPSMATLVISADGVQVPMMVALKAGSMSPLLKVQPTELSFDHTTVGDSAMQKFILLSNDGAQPIEIEIVPPTTEDFVIDVMSAKTMLAPGDTTKLPVTFAPKSIGDKSESIDIRLKGTTNSIANIGISGTAIAKPMMTMESGCQAVPGRSQTPLAGLFFALFALAVLARRRLLRS